MKIKICGLCAEEDIFCVNEVKPDYIGFVFAESRRRLSFEGAAGLKRLLSPEITAVGVFVDAKVSEIVRCLTEGIVDVVQLHGRETEADIRTVRREIEAIRRESGRAGDEMQVIKAVKVRHPADVEAWVESSADYLLFDNGQGTGRCFDWRCLKGVERDFFLAGGLKPENVAMACRQVHPYCLDVSSGVETGGRKDGEKIRRMVNLLREEQERNAGRRI